MPRPELKPASAKGLREHDAVAVDGSHRHLAHAPGLVFGRPAVCAARGDLGVEGVDVVHDDVAEIRMVAEICGRHGVAAFAETGSYAPKLTDAVETVHSEGTVAVTVKKRWSMPVPQFNVA